MFHLCFLCGISVPDVLSCRLSMSMHSYCFMPTVQLPSPSSQVEKRWKKQCNCVPDLNPVLFKPSLVSSGERQSHAPITVRVRICGVAGLGLETEISTMSLASFFRYIFKATVAISRFACLISFQDVATILNCLKHVCTYLPYIFIYILRMTLPG